MNNSPSPPPPFIDALAGLDEVVSAARHPETMERWIHDLRGSLSVIRGHARLLSGGNKGALTEDQRRSVLAIERQAHKLGRLLAELEREQIAQPPSNAMVAPEVGPEALNAPLILVADDDAEIRELLREVLAGRYNVTFANDGGEALTALQSQRFQLAIVDLHLPVLDGFAVAEAIRASRSEEPPAFMFLSAQANPETKVRALSLGAADYVTKPFDPDELMARIARIVATVRREASLRADAMTDPLTGLANYRGLSEHLERELERSRRYEEPLSLITLDLDRLKTINDEYGHDAGNEAIRLVAQALRGAVRSFDLVARQGGDEFAVLLPNTGSGEAARLADRLRNEIAQRSVRGVNLSASVGVASRERDSMLDGPALVKASDEALYRAKYAGRNRVEVTP
jgi:two-component system, cell cycle response regulator